MGTLLSITAEKYQFTAAVNDNLTTVNGYLDAGHLIKMDFVSAGT
jgi:hypothetical protein